MRSEWRVVKRPGGWGLRCDGPMKIQIPFAHLTRESDLLEMVFEKREQALRLARTLNAIRE